MSIAAVIEGALVAACFLRYALALSIGDRYDSPTSIAAYEVAHHAMEGSDADRLWGMLEEVAVPFSVNPTGRCIVITRRS